MSSIVLLNESCIAKIFTTIKSRHIIADFSKTMCLPFFVFHFQKCGRIF